MIGMISAAASHQLAKLAQTLSIEDRDELRRDYSNAKQDSDLKKWLDMPIDYENQFKKTAD